MCPLWSGNHGPTHFIVCLVFISANFIPAIYNYISQPLLLLGLVSKQTKNGYSHYWILQLYVPCPFCSLPIESQGLLFMIIHPASSLHCLQVYSGAAAPDYAKSLPWFVSLISPQYRRDKSPATIMCCLQFSVDISKLIWESVENCELQKSTAICQNLVHNCLKRDSLPWIWLLAILQNFLIQCEDKLM